MELSIQIRVFLLKIIKNNGNIEPLKDMGYEYSQIVQFINKEIEENNAEYNNGKLILTENGIKIMNQLNSINTRKGPTRWIEPEIQSKISKLNKNDVFLPKQDELWFN